MTEYQSTGDRPASEVADTARRQAAVVTGEARSQASRVAGHLKDRVGREADSQTHKAARSIRQWADDLASMAESSKPDSPMRSAAHQVANTGQRAADYLEEQGLSGVVREVQHFARTRPGVFLAGAAAAGFLVGRIIKAGADVAQEETHRQVRDPYTGPGAAGGP
ncbi:hypothetical protein [Nonomuraea roseola]|uniref:DUF3618 domain-containing protein n=1 Tax=Nonomuraea roseola TaxID=46179 RepID=A0ABV5PXT9_9ACTN